jgi:ribonuclease HII
MMWLVGIDEAGYGPNLGPLVMTAVAWCVPDGNGEVDLWKVLRGAVRRHDEPDDGRLVIADSKLVYSPARGLDLLERTALAALQTSFRSNHGLLLDLNLKSLLGLLCPIAMLEQQHDDLQAEAWYHGTTALPIGSDESAIVGLMDRLHDACRKSDVLVGACRSVVICAPRFNALTDLCDSKARALAYGLSHLLRESLARTVPSGSVLFLIDKHGGRNQYSVMLNEALPAGFVWCREEGPDRSVYDVEGLDRPVRIRIEPRADLEHFPVALASMISKYIREALMVEFNTFWQMHVPGLEPTAGYPGDSSRFFADIRAAVEKLGLQERQVWRRK